MSDISSLLEILPSLRDRLNECRIHLLLEPLGIIIAQRRDDRNWLTVAHYQNVLVLSLPEHIFSRRRIGPSQRFHGNSSGVWLLPFRTTRNMITCLAASSTS